MLVRLTTGAATGGVLEGSDDNVKLRVCVFEWLLCGLFRLISLRELKYYQEVILCFVHLRVVNQARVMCPDGWCGCWERGSGTAGMDELHSLLFRPQNGVLIRLLCARQVVASSGVWCWLWQLEGREPGPWQLACHMMETWHLVWLGLTRGAQGVRA